MSNYYYVNDIVICKLKDGYIVPSKETKYDERASFKIIGHKYNHWEEEEFILYVPEYELGRVKTKTRVNQNICREYDIEKKFLGEFMTYIRAFDIVETQWKADGMFCSKCKEYFVWAEKDENQSFTCASCRLNPWR